MNTRAAVFVLFLAAPALADEPKEFSRLPSQWNLGDVGQFPPQDRYAFEVMDVIGENEFKVQGISGEIIWIDPFIVRGMNTKGFVDGKRLKLDGKFKVVDTKKYRGATLFVVSPEPMKR